MPLDITITVDRDHITIDSLKADLHLHARNCAVMDGSVIVAVGKTRADLAAENPIEFARRTDRLAEFTLFDPAAPDFELAAAAIRYWVASARQKFPIRGPFMKPECAVNFPGYDEWPEHIRHFFEYELHQNQSLIALSINGTRCQRIDAPTLKRDLAAARQAIDRRPKDPIP